MPTSIEALFIIFSALIILSIFTIKLSVRFGIPSLVLFIVIGMLAGSDEPGRVVLRQSPTRANAGRDCAGVDPVFRRTGHGMEQREVGAVEWLVAVDHRGSAHGSLGGMVRLGGPRVVVSRGTLAGGNDVSSTDAAAVFMVLRARNAKLPPTLANLLELESGSNDPMGVVLTLAIIQLLTNPATSLWELLGFFVIQMTVGAVLGVAMGELMRWTLNTLKLELRGIYPVLSVAFALLTYGLTAELQGSGFLAVYLAGLFVRRRPVAHQRSLVHFHDGLAWLMQITMFLILGLQVFPARLLPIAGIGLLVSLFLILVARPFSVHVALAFSRLSFREQTLIAWVGLRGAVPVVLATFPVLAGIQQADTIFHLVFFIAALLGAAPRAADSVDHSATAARPSTRCDGGTVQEGSAGFPMCLKNGAIVSMGMGKIVVEFLSAAISTSVWR